MDNRAAELVEPHEQRMIRRADQAKRVEVLEQAPRWSRRHDVHCVGIGRERRFEGCHGHRLCLSRSCFRRFLFALPPMPPQAQSVNTFGEHGNST